FVAFSSLQSSVIAIAVLAVGLVVMSAVLSAALMSFSVHDLTVLVVVLAFGLGLGLMTAVALARPLATDLDAIRTTVKRVSSGDLEVRTGVARNDELGMAAEAVDEMIARLAEATEERSRQQAARREFLAAVGHDLRSPLAALQAAVEALEDGLAPDPQRYLRSMRADVDAMGQLVDDLFLLSRIESGNLTFAKLPVDVAELADESIEALQPVARRHEVELRLEADGRVAADAGPAEIGRVIRNLVDNAIRYSPPGSLVTVRVANGDGARVTVSDQGPGFPPDMLQSAFEGFVTGDPARSRANGGAGLGLAIARGLVEAHDGRIWAEAGEGGKVVFALPTNS
ncbi:MAG: HAMP domain-containing histidine kinase, partial [Acidimicrobiia bacterium]|nr:HAMP domain-containing histidine kinase [Acidimicrobiia bacterium]